MRSSPTKPEILRLDVSKSRTAVKKRLSCCTPECSRKPSVVCQDGRSESRQPPPNVPEFQSALACAVPNEPPPSETDRPGVARRVEALEVHGARERRGAERRRPDAALDLHAREVEREVPEVGRVDGGVLGLVQRHAVERHVHARLREAAQREVRVALPRARLGVLRDGRRVLKEDGQLLPPRLLHERRPVEVGLRDGRLVLAADRLHDDVLRPRRRRDGRRRRGRRGAAARRARSPHAEARTERVRRVPEDMGFLLPFPTPVRTGSGSGV